MQKRPSRAQKQKKKGFETSLSEFKVKEPCPVCGCKSAVVKNDGMFKVVMCAKCGTVRRQIDCEGEWFG